MSSPSLGSSDPIGMSYMPHVYTPFDDIVIRKSTVPIGVPDHSKGGGTPFPDSALQLCKAGSSSPFRKEGLLSVKF